MLFEAEDRVGGLSASLVDDGGFTWDIGGHVTFSHYRLFDRVLDEVVSSEGWLHHQRACWIRLADEHAPGCWIPYPFQNNIQRLPEALRDRCLRDMRGALAAVDDAGGLNALPMEFDAFLRAQFGATVHELFLGPYNEKVWTHPLEVMSRAWIGERIALPDIVRIERNIETGLEDVGWGPNNEFRFPSQGGTGAIWQGIAKGLPVDRTRLGCRVTRIDVRRRRVLLENGESLRYGTLLSTLPLDVMAGLIGDRSLKAAASRLLYSSVNVVGVALSGCATPAVQGKCWMYFPDPSVPFYRVTHFSHYSPGNVPDPESTWSLMCEVSESAHRPVDQGSLADDVVAALVRTRLVDDPSDVLHVWTHRVEHGYPTPTLGRDPIVFTMLRELEGLDITSRGRFGAWRYEVGNMDHSFMQGVEAAGHLLHGSPEITVWHPDVVNTHHPVLLWDRVH
jgi:protoporphyrinogen oxidase